MERRNITPVQVPLGSMPTKIKTKETRELSQTKFTKAFHMVQDLTNKVADFIILWPSKRIIRGEEVESQFLGRETMVRWVTEGRDNDEEGDILQLLPDGRLIPSYLPDMSDLALLPIPLKAAVKWYVTNAAFGGNHGCSGGALDKMLWQSPRLHTEREWAWMHEGCNNVQVSSYLDTFKILVVPPTMRVVETTLSWQRYTTNHLDGRKWKVNVRVVWRTTRFSRLKRYLIWNCKGMARATFGPNIKHIIETHSPDCIILLETRCSGRMAKCISRISTINCIRSTSAVLGEGGASLLINASDISVHLKDKLSPQSTKWQIECK